MIKKGIELFKKVEKTLQKMNLPIQIYYRGDLNYIGTGEFCAILTEIYLNMNFSFYVEFKESDDIKKKIKHNFARNILK